MTTSSRTSRRKPQKATRLVRPTLLLAVLAVLTMGWALHTHLATGLADLKLPAANKFLTSHTAKASLPATAVARQTSLAPIQSAPITSCATNTLAKNVIVSIGQRHMWACSGTTTAYDSPVITGMAFLAADLTPTGTFHIYGKQTNLYLNGSDSTGSWHDYVYYWMPFLSNRYGVYGFHDATWRGDSAFGNVSPNSSDASHGCVELPLATAAWLSNWAPIGTTVTIVS